MQGRLGAVVAGALLCGPYLPQAVAKAYVPTSDSVVLAELPMGTRYADLSARRLARGRLDVAVSLARFYIQQSRTSGDLRYLGYAEAVLTPWVHQPPAVPDVLVLQATVQQSRHDFSAALATLDRSLAARRNDAQAWLIRATILRVLGRYDEAATACEQFAHWANPTLSTLCRQGLRGLNGSLASAYATLVQLSPQGLLDAEKAWLDSELGEMAVRLGRDAAAEHWFRQGLALVPTDFYVRAAYADLLLRQRRAPEALTLLQGQDSLEPLLLRIAIAQKMLRDPRVAHSSARLEAAFATEAQRGEAVHRREQARFLLEVEDRPKLALAAALENWKVQREPDDVLVFVKAARAVGNPGAAQPALDFVRTQGLSDVRMMPTPKTSP